jgi:hypothetical protein
MASFYRPCGTLDARRWHEMVASTAKTAFIHPGICFSDSMYEMSCRSNIGSTYSRHRGRPGGGKGTELFMMAKHSQTGPLALR